MEIRKATYKEVLELKGKEAPCCGFPQTPDTVYIAAFNGNEIVGCVGYRLFGKRIELKSDVVRRDYRGKGIYTMLSKIRRKQINEIPHEEEFAYCTEYSIGKYISDGFMIQKKYKRTYKVKREA